MRVGNDDPEYVPTEGDMRMLDDDGQDVDVAMFEDDENREQTDDGHENGDEDEEKRSICSKAYGSIHSLREKRSCDFEKPPPTDADVRCHNPKTAPIW